MAVVHESDGGVAREAGERRACPAMIPRIRSRKARSARSLTCPNGGPARESLVIATSPSLLWTNAAMRIVNLAAAVIVFPVSLAAQATQQATPAPEGFGAPFKAKALADGPVKVGPVRGTVVVV